MKNDGLKLNIDLSDLDEAIEKAKQLKKLLQEVCALIDSLRRTNYTGGSVYLDKSRLGRNIDDTNC